MKDYIDILRHEPPLTDLADALQDLWEDLDRPNRSNGPSTDGLSVSGWLIDPETLEPSDDRDIVVSEYRRYQELALAAANYHHIGDGQTITDYRKTPAMRDYCDQAIDLIFQWFTEHDEDLIQYLYDNA